MDTFELLESITSHIHEIVALDNRFGGADLLRLSTRFFWNLRDQLGTGSYDQVMSRNLAARDIVSGFASATPTLSVVWHHLQAALADTRDLATEVTRLSGELAAARLWHANALAAMRATIGAHRDGEPDPLYYIRDELSTSQNLAEAREGGRQQ
jgi:hypothetical protein